MSNAFLLTRQWRDTRDGVALDFWWATDQGPCWTQITGQEIVFFVARAQAQTIARLLQGLRRWRMAQVDLKTFDNQPVNALYFFSQRTARDAQQRLDQANLNYWEADIRPPDRYLMERFVTAAAQLSWPEPGGESHFATSKLLLNKPLLNKPLLNKPLLNPRISPAEYHPQLRLVSLDIETSMDAKQLYSIAERRDSAHVAFMIDERVVDDVDVRSGVFYFRYDKQCRLALFDWLQVSDTDVLLGWNLVQFDLWVMENRCKQQVIELQLGRAGRAIHRRQEA